MSVLSRLESEPEPSIVVEIDPVSTFADIVKADDAIAGFESVRPKI